MTSVTSLHRRLETRLRVLNPEESFSSLKTDVQSLEAEHEAAVAAHQRVREQMLEKLRLVESLSERLEAGQVMDKLRRSAEIVTEIRVLQLAQSLQELQSNTDVTTIPSIVSRCAADLIHVNEGKSQDTEIMKFCGTVTDSVRRRVLEQFLHRFEEHLTDDKDEDESDDEDWARFVKESKEWLLAYSLVSLLPLCSRSTSEGRVVERFSEALDEILLPLWGRYHFHLDHARESQSQDQVLWTFQYSIHFCHLVIGMIKSILASGQMKIILNVNYQLASNSHVINKITRFMRSHVAQVLVDCDQSDSTRFFDTVLVLIEASLEFDHQLQLQEPAYVRDCTLCSIFVDTAAIRDVWIERDFDFFKDNMLLASLETFEFKFSSHESVPTHRCFHGVYMSIVLLFAASQRYQFLPRLAVDRFSHLILEPLLLCGMGFLLYQIRHDPVLRSITEERYFESNLISTEDSEPVELRELVDSGAYFQQALKNLPSRLCFGFGRLPRKWKMLLPWIKSASFADLPPKNLVMKVFDAMGRDWDAANSDKLVLTDVQYCIEQVAAMVTEMERQYRSLYMR